jgi:maleylacetoacetate isomerase
MAWVQHWLREGLTIGETRLAGDAHAGRYVHGNAPSIADLCLISHAVAARVFKVDFSDLPTISRIVATCLARDEFARALPMRQPGAPSEHG